MVIIDESEELIHTGLEQYIDKFTALIMGTKEEDIFFISAFYDNVDEAITETEKYVRSTHNKNCEENGWNSSALHCNYAILKVETTGVIKNQEGEL